MVEKSDNFVDEEPVQCQEAADAGLECFCPRTFVRNIREEFIAAYLKVENGENVTEEESRQASFVRRMEDGSLKVIWG